ncbi:MAG: DNA gyrase/topoisomerase IV subunit A, partial [Candidatus Limisoma sp.]
KGSKIWWFSANPNGEAETLRVTLKEKPRLKKLQFDIDFADIAVKGKGAIGNLVTRNDVHRISLKERGTSTLGGREVWFDPDVLRLNYDGRGFSLGEFFGNDLVLVVLKNGQFYTSTFDATNHYEDNILFIEKYRPKVVWTAVLNDADQGYPYIKRFAFEATSKKQSFIGENADSRLLLLSEKKYPRFRVTFGGADEFREPLVVDAEEYIGEKSYKAKGKRLTTYTVGNIEEIEPREVPEEELETVPEIDIEPADVVKSDDVINQNDVRDELTGQMRLFEDEI